MEISVLVRMANDIGNFFESYPDRDLAVKGIAEHLRDFWDPSMRRQLIEHVAAGGGAELHEAVKQAVAKISG